MREEESGAGGGRSAAGRLDRSLYSEFARHVLRVVKPDGSDALLESGRAAVQRARRTQRDLRALHRAPPVPSTSPASLLDDLLEDIDNGKFMELLDTPLNLLPADMKLDLHGVDVERSIEHFEAMREELESRSAGPASAGQRVEPLKMEDMLLKAELEQFGEAVRRFDSRFSNVEIDERLDSSKRRNMEVENKIEKMHDIIQLIEKMIDAKKEILKSEKASDALGSPAPIVGSEVIEQILCQTENLTYNLVNAHLDQSTLI